MALDIIEAIPLAELHRHLDGSLRPATLRALADQHGVQVPEDIRFYPGMGLHEALARFSVTLSVLQQPEAVRRVAAEMCEDAVAEGITTLEIRFAPQLHHGAPLGDIVDAALEGVDGRAGIILCALYGEPPALVESLVETARTRPGVVAIDLAGGPTPGHDWRMDDYGPAFTQARNLGIGRTVHAAEGRPVEEIRTAIEVLHAQRIGHGTTLLDSAAITQLVLDRGVVIESCPTSNMQTGAIESLGAHPIPKWLARGVKVCVNTDNTLLSDITLPEELSRVAAIDCMTADGLHTCIATGHAASFKR